MVIVGVKCVTFRCRDVDRSGFEVYFEYPKDGVDGFCTANAYLDMSTCNYCKYMPVVGDKVKVKFRRHKDTNRLSCKWIYPDE